MKGCVESDPLEFALDQSSVNTSIIVEDMYIDQMWRTNDHRKAPASSSIVIKHEVQLRA